MVEGDQAELDRLAAVEAIGTLADELGIEYGPIRGELLSDPGRACRLMEHALDRGAKLRNPAGFVVSRFRSGQDAPAKPKAGLAPGVGPLFEHEPLTIEDLHGAIEYARANGYSSTVTVAVEAALKVAHERGEWTGFTDADRARFKLPADPT